MRVTSSYTGRKPNGYSFIALEPDVRKRETDLLRKAGWELEPKFGWITDDPKVAFPFGEYYDVLAAPLAQALGSNPILGKIYYNQGITDPAAAADFTFKKIEEFQRRTAEAEQAWRSPWSRLFGG